nr:hypothetical protein [uncultured Pseudogulbenkiania sp.]
MMNDQLKTWAELNRLVKEFNESIDSNDFKLEVVKPTENANICVALFNVNKRKYSRTILNATYDKASAFRSFAERWIKEIEQGRIENERDKTNRRN